MEALIFTSIFPSSAAVHTTPTPIATPDLGFTAPGEAFGGPQRSSSSHQRQQTSRTTRSGRHDEGDIAGRLSAAAQRAVRKNIAWSTATQFLSLQGAAVPGGQARHKSEKRTGEVQEALELLLLEEGGGEVENEEDDAGEKEDGLVGWYAVEVKEHFGGVVVGSGMLEGPSSFV
jgi:anaphase-promoting complex subunit 2